MSKSELREFQRILEAKRAELVCASLNRDEIAIEASADEIDRLQQQLNREVAIRTLDQKTRLLRNVQGALRRIADESYGVCQGCEEPIAPKRLKAIPWALYCVECQEVADRKGSPAGDDTITEAAA